jgi:uncharacterized membrane protein required for colicin V production
MPLSWIDVFLAVVIVGWVILEIRRDFGRSLFDTVAVLASMRMALLLYPGVAHWFAFAGSPEAARGTALGTLFVFFGAVMLVVSKFVHEATQWSMDSFDPIFGSLFGVTSGVIVAHMTIRILAMLYSTHQGLPTFIADSGLGAELLYFKTYHQVADFLINFRNRA